MSKQPTDESRPGRQDLSWSRHAPDYEQLFLDPFREGVRNPLLDALEAVPDRGSRAVIDLGCGTGPLLPLLLDRFGFGTVMGLDFAPGMIVAAASRLGADADRVTFLNRSMDDLEGLEGRFDVAVAVNSLVMPDVRDIDRTLRSVHSALKPDGLFLGIVPSIDAIHYHTMLLMDRALDEGYEPEEAERLAAFHAEHHEYEFAFGRFRFRGIHQKFWQPFEIRHRLAKAGFRHVELDQVHYPWDDHLPDGPAFAGQPPSWDWTFAARN